jgi:RHS repeat-associated protein
MQAKLQEQEKEQHVRIAIHHYHCDHLGTPMALTDQTGQVAWAAKLDPWGNVLQEYNPQGIHQVIRLPGQHHDRETGLYYNRHRYYDPVVGSYVNQDPIGLNGGVNKTIYPVNPKKFIDPLGLVGINGVFAKPIDNTIICDGVGNIAIKIQNPEPIQEIKECIEEHEKTHMEDAKLENSLVCSGGKKNEKVMFDATTINATETKAYNNEISCLKGKLDSMKIDSPNIDHVKSRINLITDFKKIYEK